MKYVNTFVSTNKKLAFIILMIFSNSCVSYSQKITPIWDNQEQIVLFDFEEGTISSELSPLESKIKLVKNDGVTHGMQALHVILKGDEKNSGFLLTPGTPWNTRSLGDYCLLFDVTNITDISAQLLTRVTNGEGQGVTRSATVPSGQSKTLFFPLGGDWAHIDNGMRDDPAPWKIDAIQMSISGLKNPMDFSNISSIKIYSEYNIKDKIVIIENIRLVKSPPRDPDYLVGIVDKYGQNAKMDFSLKIHSDKELQAIAKDELRALAVSQPMVDRGKYGGWKDGPQLEATGYFRTEKWNNRWAENSRHTSSFKKTSRPFPS